MRLNECPPPDRIYIQGLFLLAMVLFPEAQAAAYAELERIIGRRLPDLDDQEKRMYLRAIVLEVYRWGPSAPLRKYR